jgi:hypothetical protein
LSTAEGLGRRQLTSVLNAVPGASSLASTGGQVVGPLTSSVPEFESLAEVVPGGDAVTGLANTVLGAAENM